MHKFSLSLLPLLTALLALTACPPVDSDGDGVNDDEDCEPDNPDVFPGATEFPGDGIDSNCDGSDNPVAGGDDDTDDRIDPGVFDSTEVISGDWSCVGNLPAVEVGDTGVLNGLVEDFQEDEPVPGAHVRLWPDNDPTAPPADAVETDSASDGTFTIEPGHVFACSPFAVRVWTEFDPPETYQTFQVNVTVAGPSPFSTTLTSVSYSTFQLLQLSLGIEPEPGKGIAAGRFRDCAGNPISGGEAAVGTLNLDTGNVVEAEGYAVRYFEDEDPEQNQLQISADGLFGGMNVPPGQSLNLLIWGIPQAEAHCQTTTGGAIIRTDRNEAYCLLGYSSIEVQPDSVNIANVNLKPFPDACYGPLGDDDDSAGDDDDSAGDDDDSGL
jgi:hypothetical protein